MACTFHGRKLAMNCGNVINRRCKHVVVQMNRNKASRSNRFAHNFSTSCLSKGETFPCLPVKQVRSRRPWSSSCQQPRLLSFQQGCDDHCESVREQINEVTSSEDLFDILQALRSKGLALSLSDGVHALQKMSRLQVSVTSPPLLSSYFHEYSSRPRRNFQKKKNRCAWLWLGESIRE